MYLSSVIDEITVLLLLRPLARKLRQKTIPSYYLLLSEWHAGTSTQQNDHLLALFPLPPKRQPIRGYRKMRENGT